jgi:hypothetical protein
VVVGTTQVVLNSFQPGGHGQPLYNATFNGVKISLNSFVPGGHH